MPSGTGFLGVYKDGGAIEYVESIIGSDSLQGYPVARGPEVRSRHVSTWCRNLSRP